MSLLSFFLLFFPRSVNFFGFLPSKCQQKHFHSGHQPNQTKKRTKPNSNSTSPNQPNPHQYELNLTKPNSSILNQTQTHQTEFIHTTQNWTTSNQTYLYQTKLIHTKPNYELRNLKELFSTQIRLYFGLFWGVFGPNLAHTNYFFGRYCKLGSLLTPQISWTQSEKGN